MLVQNIVAFRGWKPTLDSGLQYTAMDTYGFEKELNNLSRWIGECQCQKQAFVGKVIVQRQEFITALG